MCSSRDIAHDFSFQSFKLPACRPHSLASFCSHHQRPARSSSPARTARVQGSQPIDGYPRSEEHTSELQSLMRISYAVFCLKKKIHNTNTHISRLRDSRITTAHNGSAPSSTTSGAI